MKNFHKRWRGEKMRYERRGRGERRGFDRGFPPKPVEIGKEYDVEIQETSRRGEGITRIKGLVTFVPNTKPGDHVRIKITRISRRFAEAEVVGEAEAKEVEEAEAKEVEEAEAKEVEEAEAKEETAEEGEAE
jgi:predicted RNA-binding protein with TRAM domain